MRTFVEVVALGLLVTACSIACCGAEPMPESQAPAREHSVADVVKASIGSVVLIVASDGSGKKLKQGSGFIVSADGRILTNQHAIEGASSAIVKLDNGSFFPVEGVLGSSADDDLAAIQVNGKDLPALSLGEAERLAVGDRVIAVGSPLALENTVSDGIVSAIREEGKRKWIQTTASASPGNSGGPLLDLQGNVVGIMTWKRMGGENLNFAVPIDAAKPLLTSGRPLVPLSNLGQSQAGTGNGQAGGRIWTSETSGRDYKVRFDGNYIYTEWVNLPAPVSETSAFMRSSLTRAGERWVGRTHAYLPFKYYGQVRWCSVETETEITSVSQSRIEGRAQTFVGFNARKCKPKTVEWESFTWIPRD